MLRGPADRRGGPGSRSSRQAAQGGGGSAGWTACTTTTTPRCAAWGATSPPCLSAGPLSLNGRLQPEVRYEPTRLLLITGYCRPDPRHARADGCGPSSSGSQWQFGTGPSVVDSSSIVDSSVYRLVQDRRDNSRPMPFRSRAAISRPETAHIAGTMTPPLSLPCSSMDLSRRPRAVVIGFLGSGSLLAYGRATALGISYAALSRSATGAASARPKNTINARFSCTR